MATKAIVKKKDGRGRKPLDLKGFRHPDGFLVGVKPSPTRKYYWLFKCLRCKRKDLVEKYGPKVHVGNTRSCGCLEKEEYERRMKESDERAEVAVAGRDAGKGWAELAKEYGVSRTRVQQMVRRYKSRNKS